jgi:hypothetical protein
VIEVGKTAKSLLKYLLNHGYVILLNRDYHFDYLIGFARKYYDLDLSNYIMQENFQIFTFKDNIMNSIKALNAEIMRYLETFIKEFDW